jgi:hypothetical protein
MALNQVVYTQPCHFKLQEELNAKIKMIISQIEMECRSVFEEIILLMVLFDVFKSPFAGRL